MFFLIESIPCSSKSASIASTTAAYFSGTVTDNDGNPLPGASVIIKGTTKGSITDFDGNFTIEAFVNNTLVFSYTGYETKEIEINNEETINIKLNDGESLDEIVVIGSRNPNRTAIDSPVPIDIVNINELIDISPQVNLNQILNFVAPSFTSNTQTISDGTDHIDPASLRGLGPDQVLVLINGGIRWDANELKVTDNFLTDGNQTDQRTLNAWSPQVGLSYTFSPRFSSFVNLSRSYETPTLSELSANPTGSGGFNPFVDIQVADNLEGGIHYTSRKTNASLVYFSITTSNDLVAYELADSPGRTFYQNAGSTTRKGVEFLIKHQFNKRFQAQITYNYANFKYQDFEQNGENYSGNNLPGLPSDFGTLHLNYHWENKFQVNYTKTYRGDLFADNRNENQVDQFFRDDVSLRLPLKKIGQKTSLIMGCTNLFNTLYSDNIRINAFGNRYFEAAPTREIYASLQWQF